MIPSRSDWTKALEIRHGKSLNEKFSKSTVAICGLGGLGSNIAISLARAGIGKLILIDFDIVDITNLHRQQYKANQVGEQKTTALSNNLREIAPYISLEIKNTKIDEDNLEELLLGADIVCEAVDVAETKAMIANEVLTHMPDKYLVATSGMAGIGSPNEIITRKITKKLYISGDGVSDVKNSIGLVSPRVMICAAHQALTVLRIIAEEFDL